MSFSTLHCKSIQEAFEEFDEKHPQIYDLFITYFFQALRANKKRISFKLIINRIRWEYYMITTDVSGYKINDAYGSRYARKFIKDFPEHEDKIELRRLRA
jgi:hypothetical protein